MQNTDTKVDETRRSLESALTRFIDEREADYLPEPPALVNSKVSAA